MAEGTRSKSRSEPSSSINQEMMELFQKSIRSELESFKSEIKNSITSIKDEIIEELRFENSKLKNKVKNLEEIVYEQDDFITDMERDNCELQQYGKRNCIEIAGIPESVKQNELESKVVKIGAIMDVKVEPSDIEACHRLPGQNLNKQGILQPRRTIVRFINRKNAAKFQR